MASAPNIENSTPEERELFIRERFQCISDCESCGNCKVLHGRDPECVYSDYINGLKSFVEVTLSLRR